MNDLNLKRKLLASLERKRAHDWSYDSGKILSSMCSSPLQEAWEAFEMFKETNALDPKIFPSVEELEREVIEEIGELLSLRNAGGYITSGGTEGNMFALWLERKVTNGEKVVAPKSVHYSVRKACDLQQVDLVLTETDEEYRADPENMQKEIDEETFAVIATAGTASLGLVDPVSEIAELVEGYECNLHVDACFGGFILPFLEDNSSWDFQVEEVSSISADPHKMGLAPIPAGAVLVRERDWLEELKMDVSCLDEVRPTLLGTRPGGSIASTWAALKSLGFEGYQKIIERCLELTQKIADGIRKIKSLDLLIEPELNIVAFTSSKVSPKRIQRRLEEKGWLVSVNKWPESVRLVVMPHHKFKHVESFLKDLETCVTDVL